MSAMMIALMGLNTVVQTVNYEYDELGRMIAQTGTQGQNVRYAYDMEGRVTQVTDSQGRVTRMDYDPLGRVIKQTDAAKGVTSFTYDKGNRVASVKDPRGLTTSYQYDGFGQLWVQQSPDTGATDHEYNGAGQRIATELNDGSMLSYGYDSAGRVTTITAADGQRQTFGYDSCAGGIGRLCSHSAPNASASFTYNPQGQLLTRRDRAVMGGAAADYTVTYGYDGIGRPNSLTYPNGQIARYAYNGVGQLSAMSLTTNGVAEKVISEVSYNPSGNRRRMVYANGLARTYAEDASGRMTAMAVRKQNDALISRSSYAYNADNEITRINDDATPSLNQAMEYDALSRLTKLTRYGVVNELSYDAGGNHTRLKAGSQITQYTIDPASNRVASYTGQDGLRKYEYDALGNRISEKVGTQTTTYTYDVFNRMAQSNAGGLTTNYVLNAQGQRMGKYSSASRKRFIYAGQNQLLTEVGQTFATNYLWFGGELVGIARSGKIYPVHTDHLGRPEYATDSTQKTVWKAYNYAYGRSVEQDDIGGLNLGFPGQYQDEETGLWYNGFRDYDASIARYVQSDPIGLAGGFNTYSYVRGNPISYIDPLGLIDLKIPGTSISIHANPGPDVTSYRAEHDPPHVHLGSNDGPRVDTNKFQPLSPADARKMTREQQKMCGALSDAQKSLIRSRQSAVFSHGKYIMKAMSMPMIGADSLTNACRSDPVTCAELIDEIGVPDGWD